MSRWVSTLDVAPDHPSYAGHFPGRPLLPGAALLAEVMQAAAANRECVAALGAAPRLGTAKFLSPVRPGAPLALTLALRATVLAFEVRSADRLVASGHFERADRDVASLSTSTSTLTPTSAQTAIPAQTSTATPSLSSPSPSPSLSLSSSSYPSAPAHAPAPTPHAHVHARVGASEPAMTSTPPPASVRQAAAPDPAGSPAAGAAPAVATAPAPAPAERPAATAANAPAAASAAPAAPRADWMLQQERSSLLALRVMRRIALGAGRRLSRRLLPPVTLYFLATSASARRESARYLARALDRPARFADVYRHFHAFAATILDRIYFLQDRFGPFDVTVSGADAMDEAVDKGEGVLMIGAHVGSFEALRAFGLGGGHRVAMIMYEDNAQLLNRTLAALAPAATLHTIALGRLDAMLSLRRWLDDGGVAGLLGDRTLPVSSQRSRNHALPFLGKPACFSDGPFRLAAMLRRPVVFMAGLYHGGNRYEVRFLPLADFRGATAADRDALIQDAMQRYVQILESLCRECPDNWFNFFDFWDEDEPVEPARAHEPGAR